MQLLIEKIPHIFGIPRIQVPKITVSIIFNTYITPEAIT